MTEACNRPRTKPLAFGGLGVELIDELDEFGAC